MQLASGVMTPKSDRKPITIQCKVYWIHTQLWNEAFIAKYHAEAPALAKEIAGRKVNMSNLNSGQKGSDANRFTCEDFVFEVLIEFSARNKLPVKIVTESAIFKNVDKDYKSGNKTSEPTPEGFALDVAYATGAKDVLTNSVQVAEKDLLPGDLFVEFNGGHAQLVTAVEANKITIMQGNFPGPGETPRRKFWNAVEFGFWFRKTSDSDRESDNYLGVPVQEGIYEQKDGRWLYQRQFGNYRGWDADVWKSQEKHRRWNFMEFNKIDS